MIAQSAGGYAGSLHASGVSPSAAARASAVAALDRRVDRWSGLRGHLVAISRSNAVSGF